MVVLSLSPQAVKTDAVIRQEKRGAVNFFIVLLLSIII